MGVEVGCIRRKKGSDQYGRCPEGVIPDAGTMCG